MDVLGAKDKQMSESKQLNKGLTQMFGEQSATNKTIKEKLKKGLYTTESGRQSQSTTF